MAPQLQKREKSGWLHRRRSATTVGSTQKHRRVEEMRPSTTRGRSTCLACWWRCCLLHRGGRPSAFVSTASSGIVDPPGGAGSAGRQSGRQPGGRVHRAAFAVSSTSRLHAVRFSTNGALVLHGPTPPPCRRRTALPAARPRRSWWSRSPRSLMVSCRGGPLLVVRGGGAADRPEVLAQPLPRPSWSPPPGCRAWACHGHRLPWLVATGTQAAPSSALTLAAPPLPARPAAQPGPRVPRPGGAVARARIGSACFSCRSLDRPWALSAMAAEVIRSPGDRSGPAGCVAQRERPGEPFHLDVKKLANRRRWASRPRPSSGQSRPARPRPGPPAARLARVAAPAPGRREGFHHRLASRRGGRLLRRPWGRDRAGAGPDNAKVYAESGWSLPRWPRHPAQAHAPLPAPDQRQGRAVQPHLLEEWPPGCSAPTTSATPASLVGCGSTITADHTPRSTAWTSTNLVNNVRRDLHQGGAQPRSCASRTAHVVTG